MSLLISLYISIFTALCVPFDPGLFCSNFLSQIQKAIEKNHLLRESVINVMKIKPVLYHTAPW